MVTLSEIAATQLKEMTKRPEFSGKGLRIFVKQGGCRGFSYGMGFDEQHEGDVVTENEGLRILVGPDSAPYIEGASIDFKDALMGGGFVISNPQAASTCGCGQSFKAKSDPGKPQ